MDAGDIIAKYLQENGFHGLYNPDGECACKLDDLFPCSELSQYCEPGYLQPCPKNCGEHDWHIGKDKICDTSLVCVDCDGTGMWPGAFGAECPTCSGTGRKK